MTLRSDRRKAELEVIDAAHHLNWVLNNECETWNARVRLGEAIVALDRLPLESPGRALVNTSSTVTAKQAAQWMHGERAASMAIRIFRAIYYRGSLGFTVEGLTETLNGKHQSVSARVNELRNLGWITDSGRTARTSSGRDAILWVASPLAKACVQDALALAGQR